MPSITGTVLSLSGSSGYDEDGDDFDILRDLLITTDQISDEPFGGIGLVASLDTVADLTVFAPKDDAFGSLASTIAAVTGNEAPTTEAGTIGFLADTLTLLGKGNPSDLLTSILTYHVAPGVLRLADIAALGDGAELTTLQGGTLTTDLDTTPPSLIDADDGIGNPGVVATDIEASNGVIHVIDGVLLPVSVSSILTRKGTDLEIGDDDNERFSTGRGMDFVDGNGGSDLINTGAGRDIVNGGSGSDWLIGGAGADTFVFALDSGLDIVADFRNAQDMIDLSGYVGIESFDDISHSIENFGKGVKIELDGSDSLLLFGVRKGQMDASDFSF
jgi:uncharacterized surface protein with fasciclin (FAS1) repeats